jgi:hypothetical protein
VLTIPPSIRLLRRTGLHVALVALNIVPVYGTVVLIWIIAYSNWPNSRAAKSANVAPIVTPSPMYEGGFAMRPKTIVYFERIIFGTLLLAVLQVYLSWDRIKAFGSPPDRDLQAVIYLIVLIVMSALVGTLTLLVSRRRSKIAMWVSIAMAAYGIWLVVSGILHERLLGSNIIPALQCVGQAVAYGLLFTPSARRWMRREDEKEREAASSGARPQHFT